MVKGTILAVCLCCAAATPAAAQHNSATTRIRVAIIDGQSAGAYHNWRLTTPVLKKELEETGLFAVSVLTAPPSDGDFGHFNPELGHDVFAMSCVGFVTTFQRGTKWAATGCVTQKVPATFPTANTVSYRADIAQMDPAFLNGASPVVP